MLLHCSAWAPDSVIVLLNATWHHTAARHLGQLCLQSYRKVWCGKLAETDRSADRFFNWQLPEIPNETEIKIGQFAK